MPGIGGPTAEVTQVTVEVAYVVPITAEVTQVTVEVAYVAPVVPPVPASLEDIRLYDKTGKRKRLPREWVADCSFEYSEKGGWENGALRLVKDFDATYFEGTEYVEVWLWGRRMFRGWAIVVDSSIATPDTLSLRLYGFQQKLAGLIVRRDYCYPGQTNIDTLFRDMVTETAKTGNRFPNLEIQTSVFSLGLYISTFAPNGKTLPEALNSLLEMFPETLIWGCDVDPATGLDRIYLRPRATDSGKYKFAIGGNITGFLYPRDATQIINRLLITGGKVTPPNILKNGSFETCITPGELTTNLLLSAGFEDATGAHTFPHWVRINDPTVDNAQAHTGSISVDMDDNPSAPEAMYQDVSIPSVQPLFASVWARCPTGETWSFIIRLQILDTANNVLDSIDTTPFVLTPDGTWRQFQTGWNPSPNPGATKARVIFLTAGGSGAHGMNIDDAALWFPNVVGADGWKSGTNSGASFGTLDWNNKDAGILPFDGVVKIKATPVISGGAGSYVEITSDPASHISVQPTRTYYLTAWFQPQDAFTTIDVAIGAKTYSGSTLVGTVMSSRHVYTGPAVGNNHWYQVIFIVTMGAGNDGMDFLIRLYAAGTTYIDGCGIFLDALPETYYPGDTFTAVRDIGDYGLQVSGQAAASILNWGYRERAVTVESVIDQTTLDIFAINYLNAHAPPSVQARLDIKDAQSPVLLDGRVKIINLPAAQLGDAGAALFPSRLRYDLREGVDISMDLNNERPDMTALMRALGQNPKL